MESKQHLIFTIPKMICLSLLTIKKVVMNMDLKISTLLVGNL